MTTVNSIIPTVDQELATVLLELDEGREMISTLDLLIEEALRLPDLKK